MTQLLSNICDYINEKIAVNELSDKNYISTENMLPNKSGIVKASTLPNMQLTPAYQENDVLISNIRPYFKKIWQAEYCGGCSNDVLVLRAKQFVNPKFLYYVLSEDKFFDYATATSKGTKMPRGDKSAIMKYGVPEFSEIEQEKIANILFPIDKKIAINSATNNNLEQQAQAIFKSWFVDFEPFGGTMPENWSYIQLSDLATFVGGYSYKGTELQTSNCAMATIKNFDRNGGFKLDGFKEIIPSEKLKISQEVDLFDILVAHTDLTQNAEVIGNAELLLSKLNYKKIIFSMDLVKVVPNKGISKFLLATLLKSKLFKSHCLGYVNGTTVLHLSKKALPEYSFAFPNNIEGIKNISSILESMYIRIANNINENMNLTQLRDTLLPKLMSGEIDVSEVDISADKLLFSILVFEHFYIKIVILIGVTINTMTIFTSNIIKFKLKKSFTFDN